MARTVKCKNCKFWNEQSPVIDMEDEDWGVCDLTHSESGEPIESDTLAIALDKEEWKAWLITKPDFGCYQGELK